MTYYKSCHGCAEKNAAYQKLRNAAKKLAVQQAPSMRPSAPPQYEAVESMPVPEDWKAVGMVHHDGEPYYETHKPIFRDLVPILTEETVRLITDHEDTIDEDNDGFYGGLPRASDEHSVNASPNHSPSLPTPIDITVLFTSTTLHTDLLRCATLVDPGPDASPHSRAAYLINQYALSVRVYELRCKWRHTPLKPRIWFNKLDYLANAATGITPLIKDSLTPFAPLAKWFAIYKNVTATPVHIKTNGQQSPIDLKARKLHLVRMLDTLAYTEETRSGEALDSFLKEIQPGVAEDVLRSCREGVKANVAANCLEEGCLKELEFKSRNMWGIGIKYDMGVLA